MLGVSVNTLLSYEKGNSLPDVDFLAAFASATRADFGQLVRLRLESGDAPVPPAGRMVQEAFERYGLSAGSTVAEAARRAQPPPNNVAATRQRVRDAGVDVDWALLIVQLVASGDLTPAGAEAIIEHLQGHDDEQGTR